MYTIIKTTSVGDTRLSVVGVAGWPVIMMGWPVTVGVVKVGVSASQQQTLSGTGARVYTAHGLAGRGDGYHCGLDRGRSSL